MVCTFEPLREKLEVGTITNPVKKDSHATEGGNTDSDGDRNITDDRKQFPGRSDNITVRNA